MRRYDHHPEFAASPGGTPSIRWRAGAVLAAVVVATALAPVDAAVARPPAAGAAATAPDPQLIANQDPAVLAEMRHQERLYPAAHALIVAAKNLPAHSGYAGVAFVGDGIALYYKGALPGAMLDALAAARRIGTVTVVPAAFSHAELKRAQTALTAAATKRHSDIQAVGAADDGSGLVVETMAPTDAAAMRARVTAAGQSSTNAHALVQELRLGVPVAFRVGKGPNKFQSTASRENDYAPWNGGDQYETLRNGIVRNSWCTTGFGVYKGGTSYVLTAAHCMTSPDVAYNGHSGTANFHYMGGVYQEDWKHDILLINARGYGQIFDGGKNSTYTKLVHDWGYRVPGTLVCTSGSASGVICNDQIVPYEYNVQITDSDGDTFYITDMAGASNLNNYYAANPGDSGGPVFSLYGDGVSVKGTISAVDGTHTFLYWQDMDQIHDVMGCVPMLR